MRLTILLCLLLAPAAFAAPAWSHAVSDHFEVYSAVDRSSLPEAIGRFERIYAVLARELDLPVSGSARTKLVIFAGDKDLAPYRPRPDSSAFWFDTPDGDFAGMSPLNTNTWADAAHEITHMVVGRTGAFYPVWLNEGLAEYYSTLTFRGDRVRIGGPPAGMLDTLKKSGFAIPLAQLFGPDSELAPETDSHTAAIFYAESWALTHILLQDEAYRDKAKAFLHAIAGGASTLDALRTTFGKSLDQIFSDLKKHVSRLLLPSSLVPAPAPDARHTPPIGPADAVDIELTLAEMLGWQHDPARVAQGRTALAALGARAPGSLRLLEARGLVSFYTGHCDALDDLKRAVESNSQNPAVLRAYAQLVGGADPEQQRSLFARANALAPPRPGVSIVVLPCGR